MVFFHRLTDIVTCNLSSLLSAAADPRTAIDAIVREINEGLAGARRSTTTAAAQIDRIATELEEHRRHAAEWLAQARTELTAGREDAARTALVRKQEVDAVVAGLEQQQTAARATHEHLVTVLRALEGRLAEARRRQRELASPTAANEPVAAGESGLPGARHAAAEWVLDGGRAAQVEAELAALRAELDRGG
jgi:phage shock protein A